MWFEEICSRCILSLVCWIDLSLLGLWWRLPSPFAFSIYGFRVSSFRCSAVDHATLFAPFCPLSSAFFGLLGSFVVGADVVGLFGLLSVGFVDVGDLLGFFFAGLLGFFVGVDVMFDRPSVGAVFLLVRPFIDAAVVLGRPLVDVDLVDVFCLAGRLFVGAASFVVGVVALFGAGVYATSVVAAGGGGLRRVGAVAGGLRRIGWRVLRRGGVVGLLQPVRRDLRPAGVLLAVGVGRRGVGREVSLMLVASEGRLLRCWLQVCWSFLRRPVCYM